MANAGLLDVQGLKTYFYTKRGIVKAVDDVSLTVAPSEVVGLIGESGCGKTMTALSILRLVPIPGRTVAGRIVLEGKDLLHFSQEELRRVRGTRISAVFQDPMTFLNPVMKIGDQIAEAILVHTDVNKADAWSRAVGALEMLLIPSPDKVVGYYPHQLSGGMRQRVLIAIALSCNPSLIIADEPTTALDVTIQLQILELIKKVRSKVGISLLLITHDLGIVSELCDRSYVMYAGKIVEDADVYTLFRCPSHPYTIKLLQSVLSINEFKEELVTIEGSVPDLTNCPPGCRFHPRCPYALDICRSQEPPPCEIDRGHYVSCWLYQEPRN